MPTPLYKYAFIFQHPYANSPEYVAVLYLETRTITRADIIDARTTAHYPGSNIPFVGARLLNPEDFPDEST